MNLIITILIFINSIEIIRIVRNNVDRENKEKGYLHIRYLVRIVM